MSFSEFIDRLDNHDFPVNFPGHLIGGKWLRDPNSSSPKILTNPNSGEKLLEISLDRETVGRAIDHTCKFQDKIAALSIDEKFSIIKDFCKELKEHKETAIWSMRIEAGKPLWDATSDFNAAINFLEEICSEGEGIQNRVLSIFEKYKERENIQLLPVGPTLAYLPLFTPYISFAQYFSAAVLAGCPLLLVASGQAALSGILLANIAKKLLLPEGLINFLFGGFEYFKQTLQDSRIMAVIYKGSKDHALTIRKESLNVAGRQLLVQSGGKNSVIIDKSADIEEASQIVFWGAFKNAGQLCSSTSRVFIQEDLLDGFSDSLLKKIQNMKIGPTDRKGEDPVMGPLYSKKAMDKFLQVQTMANRDAEKTLNWGKSFDSESDGYFVIPGAHILKKFDNSSAYQYNVFMCPDIAIYPFKDLSDAIANSNATDSPIVVSFLGDGNVIEPHRSKLLAPNLLINLPTVDIEDNMSVCGKYHAGHHRLNGASFLFYLTYPHTFRERTEGMGRFTSWPKI